MLGLLTVGHGNLNKAALGGLLQDAAVDVLLDVRRYPGSRRNPDVRREAMEQWLPEAWIQYRCDERLGGRRHLPTGAAVVDTWWTDAAFQAYAAHTRTDEFAAGMADMLALVRTHHTVIMCSETLWWRCHRRIIADYLLAAGETVFHILREDRIEPAHLSGAARPAPDMSLTYPAEGAP